MNEKTALNITARRRRTTKWKTRETGKADRRMIGNVGRQGEMVKRAEEGQKERIARRRYIMSGISRKIVSGARTAKMSVRVAVPLPEQERRERERSQINT